MYAQKGASTYASIGVETGVMSASPHQLIVMLFDGTLAALYKARWFLENNDIAAKGQALSKAIEIIDNGLKSSLDMEHGGELAERLSALYDYMSRSLLKVNLTNDLTLLKHVEGLLNDIASAWKEIGPAAQQHTASAQV